MKYQGIEISKREAEVIRFLQTGSNNFWDAYNNYAARKKRLDRPTKTIATWFNHSIKTLHTKGLMLHIPFILYYGWDNFIWMNPGVNASKADFQALTLHDGYMEQKAELNKVIQL